jgi:hypothetical protein
VLVAEPDIVDTAWAAPPRARSRRRRLSVWVAASIALAAALVGGLRAGTRVDGGQLAFGAGTDVVTLDGLGPSGAHVLVYHHGAQVALSLPIENRGPLPLRVTDVRLETGDISMLGADPGTSGPPLPTLARGDAATLHVPLRLGNCRYFHEREVEMVHAAFVDVELLGMTLTRRVEFDRPLAVRSPMIVDCPERTLVRGDDTRPS